MDAVTGERLLDLLGKLCVDNDLLLRADDTLRRTLRRLRDLTGKEADSEILTVSGADEDFYCEESRRSEEIWYPFLLLSSLVSKGGQEVSGILLLLMTVERECFLEREHLWTTRVMNSAAVMRKRSWSVSGLQDEILTYAAEHLIPVFSEKMGRAWDYGQNILSLVAVERYRRSGDRRLIDRQKKMRRKTISFPHTACGICITN